MLLVVYLYDYMWLCVFIFHMILWLYRQMHHHRLILMMTQKCLNLWVKCTLHNVYGLIGCNMAAKGLTEIYTQSWGCTVPEGECKYISKTPSTFVIQPLCNTFTMVLCCIARYYTVIKCYHIGVMFQKLSKRCDGWKYKQWCCSDRPACWKAWVHVD